MRKVFFLIVLLIAQIGVNAETINKIVARVNDQIITDFDVKILMFVQKKKQTYDEVLQQLINNDLIIASAKDMDYKIQDEEINYRVDQTIANQRAQYGNDKLFLDALKNEGLTLASLKENYRKQIKNQMLKEKIIEDKIRKKISISTDEIEQYYKQHKNEFIESPKQYEIKTVYLSAVDKEYMEKLYYKIKKGYRVPKVVQIKKFDKLYVDLLSDNFKNLLDKKRKFTNFIYTDKGLCFYKINKWDKNYPDVIFYTIPYLTTKRSWKKIEIKANKFIQQLKEGVSFASLKVKSDEDLEKIFKDGIISQNNIPKTYIKDFETAQLNQVIKLKSTKGYYLIKILSINPVEYYKVGKVFDKIYQKIYNEKFKELYHELLTKAKKENFVEVYR